MPKHLLLIDDDALLVNSLAFTLEQAGYRTTTAGSAWQGLASIEQDPPDLILLDIGLPDMDGLSMLRRSERLENPPSAGALIVAGDLTIDPAAHTVTCAGRPVELSPKAFDLLRVLAVNCGQVISVNEILEQVWGAEYIGEPQVVYVHIRWLREKLEEDPSQPRRILTIHGVGYKLAS